MNQIAFIIGGYSVYWSTILLALAAATAVCVFLALYLREAGNGVAAATAIPVSIVLSLVIARFIHWYCRADTYTGLEAAMTDFTSGGYALMGVFAGCFLAALILRLLRVTDNLPRMLDCMAMGGAAGIAVGRLASLFDNSARGPELEKFRTLPWAWPVVNPVSGVEENRLATFMIQAMVTGVIFYFLLILMQEERRKGKTRDGDICLLFLLCHGAAQVALDSTRYDSLFFRSNGFVSIVQVLGALGIGLAIIVFSVRMVRQRHWHNWFLILWALTAAMLGLGGYMEYHVQRHAADAVFAYSVMSACLIGLVMMGFVIRFLADQRRTGRYTR